MITRILLLVFANLVFLVGVEAIYEIGREYDRAHELYPESILISYDVVVGVYGQRWERIASFLLIIGGLADAAIVLGWYRKRKSIVETTLDLHNNL